MRRFVQTLATAAVVLTLATTPAAARPYGDDDPHQPGAIAKIVHAVKHLVGHWLDDLGWPKP